MIATIVNTLTTLSRTGKRPAFGAIFLLNNISYFRTHVLLDPANPALLSLLSKPAVDLLNSNFRTARAAYFDANFSPLMQALTDEPGGKGSAGKAATKEKFTRFFDLLEEVAERHRLAKVLEGDRQGRETVSEEVTMLVVPALRKFMQKHKEKEFSKSTLSHHFSLGRNG
jgi:exocyst complex protein 7